MKVILHHNFIKKILILLSTSIFLISCSTKKSIQKSEINPVYITNTKKFYLLSPENIQGNVDKVQLLQGSFGDNSFSINSYLQADSNGIFLSLFKSPHLNLKFPFKRKLPHDTTATIFVC